MEEIGDYCISQKFDYLKRWIEFEKAKYIPGEDLIRAKRELSDFKENVANYRRTKDISSLALSIEEKANYIRMFATEQRELADDFKENGALKVYFLRKSVKALQGLKRIVPQLAIYSNHWLATRKPINVKN